MVPRQHVRAGNRTVFKTTEEAAIIMASFSVSNRPENRERFRQVAGRLFVLARTTNQSPWKSTVPVLRLRKVGEMSPPICLLRLAITLWCKIGYVMGAASCAAAE